VVLAQLILVLAVVGAVIHQPFSGKVALVVLELLL
jgi:hypothetical protein